MQMGKWLAQPPGVGVVQDVRLIQACCNMVERIAGKDAVKSKAFAIGVEKETFVVILAGMTKVVGVMERLVFLEKVTFAAVRQLQNQLYMKRL